MGVFIFLAAVRNNPIRASCCRLFQPVFVVQSIQNRPAPNHLACR